MVLIVCHLLHSKVDAHSPFWEPCFCLRLVHWQAEHLVQTTVVKSYFGCSQIAMVSCEETGQHTSFTADVEFNAPGTHLVAGLLCGTIGIYDFKKLRRCTYSKAWWERIVLSHDLSLFSWSFSVVQLGQDLHFAA